MSETKTAIAMFVEGVSASASGLSVALGTLLSDDPKYRGLALVGLTEQAGKTYDELESALLLRGDHKLIASGEMDDEAYTITVETWMILWQEA